MIVEMFCILTVFLGGSILVRTTGFNNWALPAFGYTAGICILVIIGSLQALSGLPTHPLITLSLTLLFPIILMFLYLKRGVDLSVNPKLAVTSIASILLAVVFFRETNLVNWHTDSIHHLIVGQLLFDGNFSLVNMSLLTNRLLAVAIIHAPASFQGEYYLRSAFPLLALSTIGIFAWFLKEYFRDKLEDKYIWYFTVVGILMIITNNRFIFNGFYINGHLLMASFILISACCSWRMASRPGDSSITFFMMQILFIPSMVVTRAEGSILAFILLLPLLVSEVVPKLQRALLLGVLGLSTITWQAFLIFKYNQFNISVPHSTTGLLLLGIACLLLIPLLSWQKIAKISMYVLITAEISLWVILYYFRRTELLSEHQVDTLKTSIMVTIENAVFIDGSWGTSLVVLSILFVFVLLLTDAPYRIYFRFPITTFIPIYFILAFLRGGAYRVSDGDAFNRSLMHIFPLAIFFIVSAAASERRRIPRYFNEALRFFRIKRKETADLDTET